MTSKQEKLGHECAKVCVSENKSTVALVELGYFADRAEEASRDNGSYEMSTPV